ncbi:hypothetical protein [Burkholderia sp. BCC0405]|uniref:hypothetical protein n=1 Tax=Burkholderia sp. BCC0405 TaxID=2676298 RepID=UPI00158AEBBD|nr:hypothetical protein [Burkholderia sp. BCC0405]
MNPLQALSASASATARRTRVRWLVLAVLFAVTTINYADRAAIAIGYIVDRSGSFNGTLVYVVAHAFVAVICYLFVVGEIRRVELQ